MGECRTCMLPKHGKVDVTFFNLFDESIMFFSNSAEYPTIADFIMECFPVRINPNDGLSAVICQICFKQLEVVFNLRASVVRSDCVFRSKITKKPVAVNQNYQNNVYREDLQENVNPNFYVCNVCKKRFKKEFNLLTHYEHAHSGNSNRMEKKIFGCDLCGETFKDEDQMRLHKEAFMAAVDVSPNDSTMLFECYDCALHFLEYKDYVTHCSVIHESSPKCWSYKCQLCECLFCSKDDQKVHEARHSRKNSRKLGETKKSRNKIGCYSCKISFKTRQEYRKHNHEEHGASNEPSLQKMSQNDTLAVEQYEPVVMLDEDNNIDSQVLNIKRSTSSEEIVFNCPHCFQYFNTAASLQLHNETCSCVAENTFTKSNLDKIRYSKKLEGVEDDQNLSCYLCDSIFQTCTEISVHMENVHRINKSDNSAGKFQCTKCDDSFHSRHDLESHQLQHFQTCDVCKMVFPSEHSLKSHIEINHAFACCQCDKYFGNIQDLQMHEVVHDNGELKNIPKISTSDLCLNPFYNDKDVSRLNQKMNSSKGVDAANIQLVTPTRRSPRVISQAPYVTLKTLECQICEKRFATVYHLNHHIKRIHRNHKHS